MEVMQLLIYKLFCVYPNRCVSRDCRHNRVLLRDSFFLFYIFFHLSLLGPRACFSNALGTLKCVYPVIMRISLVHLVRATALVFFSLLSDNIEAICISCK
jgi:hypothetical protein